MRPADLRRVCLALPGATESVQWGNDHVFKIGGKMFALMRFDGRSFRGLSFKVSPESFHILTREPGVIPAPYLARAGWVALDRLDRLPADQLKAYIARAHALIAAKLPRKLQAQLAGRPVRRAGRAKARTAP
jgi:predicted DNA-binding protein (MmcQ/YjbR family)